MAHRRKANSKGWNLALYSLALVCCFSVCTAQDKLVILSPHWEGIRAEFESAFRPFYKKATGHAVEFDWRDMGGTSDDVRFVISEFKKNPNGIGIDLFFGGGVDSFQEMKAQKALQQYRPPDALINSLPTDSGLLLYDPEEYWYGTALSSFGILKNNRVIREMNLPPVSTWKDLANPQLKGWIGSGDPRSSGVIHMVYECILQSYGWDEGWKIIRSIGANVRRFDRSSATTAKECSLGNVAYSLVIDFYGNMQIAEAGSESMSMVIPAKESVVTADPIGILKGAPNLKPAKMFIDFVISDRGQTLWVAPIGHPLGPKKFRIDRMSIRPEIYEQFAKIGGPRVNPFTDLHPISYDSKKGGARWSIVNALLGAFVLDRPVSERQGSLPFTEQQIMDLAAQQWKDPLKRLDLQLSWQNMVMEEKPR